LQILEDGRLTDGKGKVVNFKNTVIIGTSNLGAEIIQKSIKEKEKFEELKKKIDELLKTYFRPEFLNRIDEIIIFESLNKEQVIRIADLLLEKTKGLLAAQKIDLELSQKAKNRLAELGFDPVQGARPLRRVIQKEIENKLSSLILEGKFQPGDRIKVDFRKDQFVFEK
jgi:ATP-dependent Clp protease ATP-binding subunit ClpA